MNTERMLQLADAIERSALPNIEFNMAHYANIGRMVRHDDKVNMLYRVSTIKECGSSCCIAGWACILFGQPETLVHGDEAKTLLDLDYYQHRRLFYNDWEYIGRYTGGLYDAGVPSRLSLIPRADAVAAIR